METVDEIIVNGVTYVRKDKNTVRMSDNYVIIRADRAGVFAGYLDKVKGDGSQFKEVVINECRRIWYWDGAATLSQLSIDGTSKPNNCKFPEAVTQQSILGVVEIIHCTEKAMSSIQGVAVWQN